MVSGRSITRRAERTGMHRPARAPARALMLALTGLFAAAGSPAAPGSAGSTGAAASPACDKPVYLTFDTGHMAVAPYIAQVLARHQVRVTFFAANEPTQAGDGSLGDHWAPWWKARAAEGHAFASHTFDHVYWRADVPGTPGQAPSFRVRASAGPRAGVTQTWSPPQYCAEIDRAARRLEEVTGQKALPLFRAPGGKTSPALEQAARACGFSHVGWAPAGFLGDELPSETFPNEVLLKKALRDVRAGDILVAHLGIWSRRDPWAPAVLEPLVTGLKQRGFCFETLREHPAYRGWIQSHPR